jgi:hypothetical protein
MFTVSSVILLSLFAVVMFGMIRYSNQVGSFDNRSRRVGKVEWKESAAVSLDMPRKNLYRSIILNLEGTLTITTAGSPVLYTGGLGSALKAIARVELIANGRDTIKSISGDAIGMKNMFLMGTKPVLTETLITAAAHPFGGIIKLPLAMPRSIREIDTLLNSGILSTLELRVTYGAVDCMFSTAPTTYAMTKADVEVHIDEAIRLDGKDEPYSAYKELYIEKTVAAASAEFQILLPVGNRYRGFLIETESDGEMANTIVNTVQIKSGTDVFFKKQMDVIQGQNAIDYDLEAQTFVGYGYVDFCPEGRLVDALNASGLSSLEMILDVSAPGTIDKVRIYPCEIVPPMPA